MLTKQQQWEDVWIMTLKLLHSLNGLVTSGSGETEVAIKHSRRIGICQSFFHVLDIPFL